MPDRLGRLHEVLNLRQVDIRIAIIDKGIEIFQSLPDRHPTFLQRKILGALLQDKIHRLMLMVEAVEFPDPGPRFSFVGTKFPVALRVLGIPSKKVVLPLIEVLKGTCFSFLGGVHAFSQYRPQLSNGEYSGRKEPF